MHKNRFITPGILLGIGLGGFLDGIIFHQILQVHSLLSAKLPQDVLVNVKTSMVGDGLFHLVTWVITATGLYMFWKAVKSRERVLPGRSLFGCMLAGWGLFNLVEGLADHYLLQVHHVVEAKGLSVYDHVFLLSGIIFIVVGWKLMRTPLTRILATK
jgi:uncharacterized membrane protein